MAPSTASQTALVLIDNQIGFTHPTHWGSHRSTPNLYPNLTHLLSAFRTLSPAPLIIHIQHLSTFPNSPLSPTSASVPNGASFHASTHPLPTEPIITKTVNSAFIGTNLEAVLREAHVRKLVVAGISTDHCVSTTVRMAANLGVTNGDWGKGEVIVVSDATAAFQKPGGKWDAETVHAVNLESLLEFAEVRTTEEVVRGLNESDAE